MKKFTLSAPALVLAIAVMGFATLLPQKSQAAVIYESATLGTTGQTGGPSVNSQFLGSRFELTAATQIDSIGGHISTSGGSVWAALFSLDNAVNALPTFGGADPSIHALAHAILLPAAANSSEEVAAGLVGVPVVLGPGAYGIIIGGSGYFGATAFGSMITNGTAIGSPSYFFSSSNGNWINGGFSNARFVVNGVTAVPAPGALLLLVLGIGGLGIARRKRAA